MPGPLIIILLLISGLMLIVLRVRAASRSQPRRKRQRSNRPAQPPGDTTSSSFDAEGYLRTKLLAAEAAKVDGQHYTAHVETVKQLKREGRLDEAESLLLRLIDATRREAKITGHWMPPWYESQLGIVRRKKARLLNQKRMLSKPSARAPRNP